MDYAKIRHWRAKYNFLSLKMKALTEMAAALKALVGAAAALKALALKISAALIIATFTRPKANAGFRIGAQSSYEQIKVAEAGINATVATSPGSTLRAGYEFQRPAWGFALDYQMKTITFLNDETSDRLIIQQPPTLYATEGKFFYRRNKTSYGLLYGVRDLPVVETITVTGIGITVATLPTMGLEISSNVVKASSTDVHIFAQGQFISAQNIGALKLESASRFGGGLRLQFFSNRWLEVSAMASVTNFNFKDSKQTATQADFGLGLNF